MMAAGLVTFGPIRRACLFHKHEIGRWTGRFFPTAIFRLEEWGQRRERVGGEVCQFSTGWAMLFLKTMSRHDPGQSAVGYDLL